MNLARIKRIDKKYWLLAGVCLVAAGLFFAWAGQSQASKQSNYQTLAASRGKLTAWVGATGTVRAAQSARLVWQAAGRVDAVQVAIGDAVTSDDVLASLANDSLPANIVVAEADLVTAQRDLDKLTKSNLTVAQAMQKLADAKQKVKDNQDKLDFYEYTSRGRVSSEVFDDLEKQMKSSKDNLKLLGWLNHRFYKNTEDDLRRKADFNIKLTSSRQKLIDLTARYNWFAGKPSEILMEQTRAELNMAIAQQEDAQRELDRLNDGKNVDDLNVAKAKLAAAQSTLNRSKIIAPFDGTVTQAEPQPGDRVSQAEIAFQIDDLSQLLIDLQISEVDINNVTIDQSVTVSFDAVQNKTYHGVVTKVDQSGHKKQGAVNFTVTVALTDADESVKPGMTAAVTITTKEVSDVLLVPNRAVRILNDQRVVYVRQGDQAVAVKIRLGTVADANSEVVGGDLKAGDLIILNPPSTAESR